MKNISVSLHIVTLQKLYSQKDKKYGKMYIGEEIFGFTTEFLSEITQISKLFLNKVSYMAINLI